MPVMIKTPAGEDMVLLARAEYDELIAANREDFADAEIARRALERVAAGEPTLTSAEMKAFLAAPTPLAFYRQRAGITRSNLADRLGVSDDHLADIESGRAVGDVKTFRKIADVLTVSLDDLVPVDT